MFSAKTIAFLDGLTRHNDKRWFDAHRADYDEQVIPEARRFVPILDLFGAELLDPFLDLGRDGLSGLVLCFEVRREKGGQKRETY